MFTSIHSQKDDPQHRHSSVIMDNNGNTNHNGASLLNGMSTATPPPPNERHHHRYQQHHNQQNHNQQHRQQYQGNENPSGSPRRLDNRRHSLIEMATFGFSPYEIPPPPASAMSMGVGLDGHSLPSIAMVTTTFDYGDSDSQATGQGHSELTSLSSERGGLHGFFFGGVSTELLTNRKSEDEKENGNHYDAHVQKDFIDDEGDDADDSLFDDDDDDDIGGIYGRGNSNRWARASQHSYKPSPEASKREVLSKRIKDVGFIGQNLGIGHLTGVCKEDAVLIPKPVTLQAHCLYISENSPLQQDISWGKPDNAGTFSSLIYRVDVMLPDQEVWTSLSSTRHPVFRIYHTDHKLFVGKQKIDRLDGDLTLRLRVCCQGEMSYSNGAKHWTQSPWSREVELVFFGYGSRPDIVEQTAL